MPLLSLKEALDNYQTTVSLLLQANDFPGVATEELKLFQSEFRTSAYTCRTLLCPHATLGFETNELLMAHEASHSQRLKCQRPGCQHPPLVSARALRDHEARVHNTGQGRRSIRRVAAFRGAQARAPTPSPPTDAQQGRPGTGATGHSKSMGELGTAAWELEELDEVDPFGDPWPNPQGKSDLVLPNRLDRRRPPTITIYRGGFCQTLSEESRAHQDGPKPTNEPPMTAHSARDTPSSSANFPELAPSWPNLPFTANASQQVAAFLAETGDERDDRPTPTRREHPYMLPHFQIPSGLAVRCGQCRPDVHNHFTDLTELCDHIAASHNGLIMVWYFGHLGMDGKPNYSSLHMGGFTPDTQFYQCSDCALRPFFLHFNEALAHLVYHFPQHHIPSQLLRSKLKVHRFSIMSPLLRAVGGWRLVSLDDLYIDVDSGHHQKGQRQDNRKGR